MVTRRPRLPGESQRKRPSPPSIVESAEATTTDNEESDVSQITVLNTVLSSTITPSSSTSSLPIAQMPSVIDLTANSQKEAANDNVMPAGKMNPQNSIQGIGTNFQFSNGEIKRNPLQTEDALQKLTEPLRTASQNNFAQAPPGFPKTRSQGRYESSVFCRICHEIGSTDIFISPCNCKGSLSLVHKHCLERWLAESNTSLCELCGYEYNTKRLPKHNAIGSVFAWLLAAGNSRERRLLLWDVFSLIILVPLALMGTSLGCKVLSKDVVGVMTGVVLAYTRFLQLAMITATITLDAGILTWTLVRLQYHFLHWYNWYKRNCKVILLGYPEPPSTLEVQHVSSATVREMQF